MKNETDFKWVFIVTILAFIISVIMTLFATVTLENVSLLVAILMTVLFILLGIIFDIIGVAVTASDAAPFHSMNSRKVKGADIAVILLQSADKVSSFCNDVVGDICGIVSGTAASIIAMSIANTFNFDKFIVTLLVTAIVAALTIGGKAMGKSFAINKSNFILYEVSKFISNFYKIKK